MHDRINLSSNPVDSLSSDNICIEIDIAKGTLFRCRRTGTTHKFMMDIDPSYKNVEKRNCSIVYDKK